MTRFVLLKLFPTGGFNTSGNVELEKFTCDSLAGAILHFKSLYPEVNLDEDGYAKEGDYSFCVAEEFNPYATNNR